MRMICTLIALFTLGYNLTGFAAELPPVAVKKGVTYVADIKPIFEKNCLDCHGPDKQKADLRLDSLEAVLKGSEDGKVVNPGNSAESQLVLSVAHLGDKDLYMPKAPKGKTPVPLTVEEIGLIRAWIDQGAK